jgi:hypothetical protein
MQEYLSMNKEHLIAARELIASRANWTKWAMARNAEEIMCSPQDKDAVCFCLVGALMKTAGRAYITRIFDREAIELTGRQITQLTKLNDEGTHESVLAFLDHLIERAS